MDRDSEKKLSKRSLPREVKLSVDAGLEKKGEDIMVLDLRNLASFTDYFVILHGNSDRQNRAIYESIEEKLKKENFLPLSIEGKKNAEWILMDYGNFVVHVFSKKARDYYLLEKLWGDSPRLSY
ncbi:MAG: ribosome silencing factor [Candidatus Aminicenantes bacterium]|nr:ribosome silencing factor [Candidatus Aminicenantes bacterium]